MSSIDLAVLDMTGTTIEDKGQVLDSFTAALRENEIAVTPDELRQWRGASKREVLRFFIEQQFGRDDLSANAKCLERTYACFRRLLEARFANEPPRPMNGVESALVKLRERGIKIALTTGFHRKVTDAILRAIGWQEGVIDASVSSDDVAQGRPAPFMIFRAMEATGIIDVCRVINVGDTALDMQAGTNAGVRGVVGVLSGAHDEEQLRQWKPTHIIQNVAALPTLVDNAFV